MVEVYHLNDKAFINEGIINRDNVDPRYYDANIGFKPEVQSKAVIELLKEGFYVLVAKVDTNSLDEAWERTNHIETSWLENDNVTAMVDKARSSKVGDVMKDDNGKFHIVASMGFTEIPEKAINEKKKSLKP